MTSLKHLHSSAPSKPSWVGLHSFELCYKRKVNLTVVALYQYSLSLIHIDAACQTSTSGMRHRKPEQPYRSSWLKSTSPIVWCRILSPPKSLLFGQPVMQITGRCSLIAPATALMTLRLPTVNVTTTHPTPLARAYPSAAYPACNRIRGHQS